jgi:hypothetical protein
MTTKFCSLCHHAFIAGLGEYLCPKCENQTELPKASRKRGDKEKLMDFNQLLEAWKKLRKEREQWRMGEVQEAKARYEREKLEKEKSMLLIALSAFDSDQDLLRQFVSAKNQLNVVKLERDRFKESSNNSIQRMAELQKENMQLTIENMRLRYSVRNEDHRRTSSTSFTKEMWRRFTQLCHPDKHDGSVAANEATRWLLENRP